MRLEQTRSRPEHAIHLRCSWKMLQCLQNKLVWSSNSCADPRSPPLARRSEGSDLISKSSNILRQLQGLTPLVRVGILHSFSPIRVCGIGLATD